MAADELQLMEASLVHRLRVELSPDDGDEAFDQHLLLAARIHRAARLNQTGNAGGKGWVRFFVSYFPSGRDSQADAQLLWSDWRVGLLKDRVPLPRVAITHGQRDLHWQTDMYGALVINLESMWDDFEYAVDQFIRALTADKRRAAVVLRRWQKRTWTVRPFQLLPQMPLRAGSRFTGLLPVGSTMAVTGSNPPQNHST